MPITPSNAFELSILTSTFSTDMVLKLYTNDINPSGTDTVATYTEATQDGYDEITLTGGSWNISTVNGAGTAEYAQQTFTFTEAVTVYGYYVTNVAGDVFHFAERFQVDDGAGGYTDAPAIIGSSGGTVNVTPKFAIDKAA